MRVRSGGSLVDVAGDVQLTARCLRADSDLPVFGKRIHHDPVVPARAAGTEVDVVRFRMEIDGAAIRAQLLSH